MDLNDFKQLYKDEKVNEVPEISLEKQNEIHLPIEIIRKNMRMEFWSTVPILISVLFLVYYFGKHYTPETIVLFILFWVTFLFIVVYYYYKFYKFYYRIPQSSSVTKESLSEVLFDMKLNTEIYKTYYVACIPLFLAEFAILFYIPNNHFSVSNTILVAIYVASCLFIVFFGKWWYQYFYGKYIDKVEEIYKSLS